MQFFCIKAAFAVQADRTVPNFHVATADDELDGRVSCLQT
jgi:hypothetical protein